MHREPRGQWLELTTQVAREAAEAVSAVFAEVVYGGVAIEEGITARGDSEGYTLNTSQPVTVRGYLPVDDNAGCKVTRLKEALDHLSFPPPVSPLQVRPIAEEDWANAWKEHFHVHRVGQRLVVVPSWREYTPQPGEITILLDPGMAFGTGLHPTTQMCLAELERQVQPGMRVLDLGTGSGILAIAAARLGAARVLALDTDSIAVQAARANGARNGLEQIVEVQQGSLPRGKTPSVRGPYPGEGSGTFARVFGQRPFDLIVANIIAQVISDLAESLAAALAPAGLLIASGLIAERAEAVWERLAAAGLALVARRQEGDWVTFVGKRCIASSSPPIV
jgi:ribosomal protein L11 methyltransferase